MRVIEVLGSGCQKCQLLEEHARQAVALAGVEAEVRHVSDIAAIASRGILQTPGLAIDGRVVSAGRVPSASVIAEWLAT